MNGEVLKEVKKISDKTDDPDLEVIESAEKLVFSLLLVHMFKLASINFFNQ